MVELAGDVAFERAEGFSSGFAFFDAAFEVGARVGLVFGADDGDGVDGVVGLAVTAGVEAVACDFPG